MKSKTTALILSILLGGLGIDRFYLGYTGMGVLKLLTGGCFGILTIIDIVYIATGKLRPADGSPYEEDLQRMPQYQQPQYQQPQFQQPQYQQYQQPQYQQPQYQQPMINQLPNAGVNPEQARKLEKLQSMLQSGLIKPQEYETMRQQILSGQR